MTRKNRVLCLITAGVLCVALAFSALAEGKLIKLWTAGCDLLLDTENVTLSGHAVFTLDGEVFKTFNGSYQQDTYDSCMQVTLDTPKEDGSVYTGGYTVTVNDGVAYSVETAVPHQVGTVYIADDKTILSNSYMQAFMPLIGGALDVLEGALPFSVTEEKQGEGAAYRVTIKTGEVPGYANELLTKIVRRCAEEYLFIGSFAENQEKVSAFYYDYPAFFANYFEKIYNEKLPENYEELIYDENGSETALFHRCRNIEKLMQVIFDETVEKFEDSGLGVIMDDGSVKEYESYEDYLIDTGKEEVYYETDLGTVFEKWYEKTTGEKPDGDAYNALYEEDGLFDKMNEDFAKQLRAEGYPCGIVHADGTITGYKDADVAAAVSALIDETPTVCILSTLSEIKVDQADMTVVLDGQGRISSVEGEASFVITDMFAKEHTLNVEFDGKAFDYGKTKVEAFDTDAYLSSVQ